MNNNYESKYRYLDKQFLDELALKFPLVDLVSKDITLKKDGPYYKGVCPFHGAEQDVEEKESFCISTDYNRYYCYNCHAKGNIINWLMNREQKSFTDVVTNLAEKAGIALPENSKFPDEMQGESPEELSILYEMVDSASNIYRYRLKKQTEALHYLIKKRRLNNDTIEQFQLGIVTSGIVQLLKNHYSESQLLESSIAVRSRINDIEIIDLLRYRICLPIHNENGVVIGFAGRTYRGENSIKYLNTSETPIFQKKKELYGLHIAKPYIHKDRIAIIVEGFFDVLALHQRGENRAVGLMGTGVSKEQIKKLLTYADKLIFAFDGDEKGKAAVLNTAFIALSEINDNQMVYFAELPQGEDPDSFIHENGLASWQEVLENAKSLSDVFIEFITLENDNKSAIEKAQNILMQITKAEYFQKAFSYHLEKILGKPIHL